MPSISSYGVTIRIYLADGSPQGLRVLERMGWTGVCLAFSRSDYPSVRARPELGRTGVYVLQGPESAGPRPTRLYVGEGDEIKTRLDAHYAKKDFWTNAYLLTTKDDSLNKAHVRYLEAKLLEIANEAGDSVLDNGTSPPVPYLSEPGVAEMESYLENALILFPLTGVFAFDVVSATLPSTHAPVAAASPPLNPKRYFLKTDLTEAEGRDDSRGFTVLEGGLGRHECKVMHGRGAFHHHAEDIPPPGERTRQPARDRPEDRGEIAGPATGDGADRQRLNVAQGLDPSRPDRVERAHAGRRLDANKT